MALLTSASFLERFKLSSAPPKDIRVLVAMSGGVDSSVTAAILKALGYDVVGVTLLLYDHGEAVCDSRSCCGTRDIEDARRVAEKLDISHYVLDRMQTFKEEVISPFVESYKIGLTPLPCADCNKGVKFRDLLALADDIGASYLVTGHYANVEEDKTGHAFIRRGADALKDQSYFLFGTPKATIHRLRFPLGMLDKPTTRKIAAEMGLSVSQKPDSQGLCFVPSGNYRDVLLRLCPEAVKTGQLVHVKTGEVFGQHKGVGFYTIGQRRGLDIGGLPEPLYVVRLCPETNTVFVGELPFLEEKVVYGGDFHWLGEGDKLPPEGIWADVQVRYHHTPQRAFIQPLSIEEEESFIKKGVSVKKKTRFSFEEPVSAFAPGQALVAYQGDILLGGATATR